MMQEEEALRKMSSRIERKKTKKGSGLGSLFRRMKVKESWRWRLKFLESALKWKGLNWQLSFFDDLVFKIVSVLEAVVLIATLCFFFMFCGCHF